MDLNLRREPDNYEASVRSDSVYGARATPRSVMIAVTYRLGVTSKAGFSTGVPAGATAWPTRDSPPHPAGARWGSHRPWPASGPALRLVRPRRTARRFLSPA